MENGAGRQADSEVGRCALSARQWELCGRYSSGPDAVCGRVPKCLAAWARTAHPHGNGRGAARVIGVFTQADFAGLLRPIRSRIASMPGFEKFLQLPIATDKVRYVGEPMAVAGPTSPYLAEDAASLISAEVEELDAILDWKAARKSDILVHELAGTNFSRVDVGRGDA